MAHDVSMIYNEDAGSWPQYLQSQITDSETVDANTFLTTDNVLFKSNSRAETRVLKSKVVLVVVTPGHVDYLQNNRHASYERLVDDGNKGILFLLGFEEKELSSSDLVKKFPEYEKWSKVKYDGDESIKKLLLEIVEVIEQPESLKCGFSVMPMELRCEEETPVALMIEEPIPQSAKVIAKIKGTHIDEEVTATRVNPQCYTIVTPKSNEGEATIFIDVNKKSLGSQVKVKYVSLLPVETVESVGALYCHCLDAVCKLAKSKSRFSQNDVDEKISEIFDYMVDLPVAGYESLFGMYQYYTSDKARTEIPTLVHLSAKYDLKETAARLEDLPHFTKVSSLPNKASLQPHEVADQEGHHELASHLREIDEQMEMYMSYAEMLCHYQQGPQTDRGYINTHRQDEMECYMGMDIPQNVTAPAGPRAGGGGGASFPMCPEEDYLPMDGAKMSGQASAQNVGKKDSESDEEYQIVEDWQQAEKQPQSGKVDTTNGEVSGKSPERKGPAPTLNDKDIGLIQLQEKVRDGKISIEEAEILFREWQKKHKHDGPSSFKQKQEMLKATKAELAKMDNPNKKSSIMDKLLKRKKQEPKTSSKPEPSFATKSTRTTSFTRGKISEPIMKKEPAPEPKNKPLPFLPAQNQPIEENPYATRDPPAPPAPHRGPRSGAARAPTVPSREQKPVAAMAAVEPEELYLDMGGKDEEDYTYVAEDIARSTVHDHPLPQVPPQSNTRPRQDGLYLDDRSVSRLGRFSGSSSGSRDSNLSTGSSRESTVSQMSSGIDTNYRSEEDIVEEEEEMFLLNPYHTVDMHKSCLLREADHFGSRDSGLERICEVDDHKDAFSFTKREDYDSRSAKRASIQDRDLPEPPEIPARRTGGRPRPLPDPQSPPAAPESPLLSIPNEPPPPIPSAVPPGLERVEEEEISEEERKRDFLKKIGATPVSYLGSMLPPQQSRGPPTPRKPLGPKPPPKPR